MFVTEKRLKTHSSIHKPHSYVCEKCGRSCLTNSGLQQHMKTHEEKEPLVKPWNKYVKNVMDKKNE
jgi:hypothetical protein